LTYSAAAQTAEETALFLTFGLEDGLKDKEGKTVIRQINKNTWTFADDRPEKGLNIEVIQISSCKYRFVSRDGIAEIDFNKVREFRVSASLHGGSFIQIIGPEVVAFTRTDGQVKSTDIYEHVIESSPDRYNRAIAYLRSSFCKGRAF
jgi:hypothetical protein